MGIFIKDPETDKAVRKLAKLRGVSLTEAIRSAVTRELELSEPSREDVELKKLQEEFASYPSTGLKADKAFYDSLYED
jgi:antitoxin VapB